MKKIYLVPIIAILVLFSLPKWNKTNTKDDIEIPVFLYHSIKPELEENDIRSMVVTIDNFEKDLLFLKDNGYTTISIDEYNKYFNGEEITMPQKPVLITFDDGYLNNYEYAYPLLKKYNSKATIYIIGWSVGRDKFILNDKPITPHFTWEQSREMLDSGLISLGSHTYDMHNPEGISYGYEEDCGFGVERIKGEKDQDYYDRLYNDLKKLQDLAVENLGLRMTSFAYPYGVYNETIIKVLKDLDFETAFITESKDKNRSNFEIRRRIITEDLRLSEAIK